jgi:hypothetical protein
MRLVVRGSWALALLAATGTGSGCHSATDPTPPCYVDPPTGTNQAALYKVAGPGACGTGATSVTPVPNGGTFAATIRFRVKGATPNTTYFVQRAAEFPPNPTSADTTCQRADQLPPWTAADGFAGAAWVTFPRPYTDQGPPKTLTTDAAGDGSLDFDYRSPQIPAGTKFDVEMRLVDADTGDEAGVTTELRSGCMTVLPL